MKLAANTRGYVHIMQLSIQQLQTSTDCSKPPYYHRH